MRGVFTTAVHWLGLPACTPGWYLAQQLDPLPEDRDPKLDPGYDNFLKKKLQPPVDSAQLKQVQVLFRHGARTPLTKRYWEGSTWNDCGDAYTHAVAMLRGAKGAQSTTQLPEMRVVDKQTQQPQGSCIDGQRLIYYPGGCTRGELTMVGQAQAVRLGQWLRHRYVLGEASILPESFEGSSIQAHSTNYRRTRDTMYGVMLGLYPDNTSAFQVYTSTHLEEIMLAQVSTCSKLGLWYKAARAHLAHDDRTSDNKVVADRRIRKLLGMPMDDEHRISWTELHDALTTMRAHGQPIPTVLSSGDLDVINALATQRVVRTLQDENNKTVLGLALGRLLQKMEDRIDEAAHEGGPGGAVQMPRMWLWCGHDTTIIPVLLMLGQDVARWPPYTSSVVLELWEDTRDGAQALPVEERHYVRVLYNGHEVAVPSEMMEIGQAMTLRQFKEHVTRPFALTAEEHVKGCTMTFEHESGEPKLVEDTSSIT